MNEQLQQAVAVLIEKSIRAFESGADFMADQLPEVVQQLLMWHTVLSAMKAVGAVLIVILLIVATFKAWKWAKSYKGHTDAWFVFAMFSVIGWGVFLPGAGFLWNLTWLQIWVAPKIFLIEYAARMVTK